MIAKTGRIDAELWKKTWFHINSKIICNKPQNKNRDWPKIGSFGKNLECIPNYRIIYPFRKITLITYPRSASMGRLVRRPVRWSRTLGFPIPVRTKWLSIYFFAHISVILYVTIFKSEETRARERSRPLRKCRRVCLLKGVSPRPGRKNIACFFQRKERRHAQQNTRGHFRTRCMWHPTDREEKNKNAIQHSYKKKERLCCPPFNLANAHKLTTITIPCWPNS